MMHGPINIRSFLIFSHLRIGFPSGLFSSDPATKSLYAPLLSPIRATCPVDLILLDLITQITRHTASALIQCKRQGPALNPPRQSLERPPR